MTDEDWVSAAMTDDSMVVDLLVHLNQTVQTPSQPKPKKPLHWTVRQPRSKTMTLNKPTTSMASPTTPLSWSPATSISGGAGGGSGSGGAAYGGFEESSSVFPKDPMRSKVTGTSETTTTKRSRKKTLAELRDEEILLLKERRHLKKELATFRINLEKQKAKNEQLKRMKLDLESQPAAESVSTVAIEETISDQFQQKIATCDPVPPILPPIVTSNNLDALPQPLSPPTSFSQTQKEVSDKETQFVLPDLNLPFEDDSYGLS